MDEEKMDADSHIAFIEPTLAVYGSSLSAIQVLIADNAPTNISSAKKIGVPFTGCGSDRFNLAVEQYLIHFKALLDKVRFVMNAYIAALRRFTSRRGCPWKLYSDNATNFTGSQSELEKLQKSSTQNTKIFCRQQPLAI